MVSILKSGFTAVLGSQQPNSSENNSSSTVEVLVERVRNATVPETRRDAVRALKSLSKKFRYEVGTVAMDVLIDVLRDDRSTAEMLGYSLDSLANIISADHDEDGDESHTEEHHNELGEKFTQQIIERPQNVNLILTLLEEKDFNVRWPAVRLLTNLLRCRPRELQEILLISPGGIPKLVDLLLDGREIIRNDALLLLSEISQSNANIQKIIAYENAFERLLDIIEVEGDTIVVEDCLYVMLNLLKNNPSNQQLFKENSLIQRLTPLVKFEFGSDDQQFQRSGSSELAWTPQKVANTLLMLQVVRTLLSPLGSSNLVAACQKIMKTYGLLAALCEVLMATGIPADVLTEVINAVAECIRGGPDSQDYFATVMAPSDPPRPALVVLLMSMVNEKQQFPLRCAILYCVEAYLYRNDRAKAELISTLLPATSDGVAADSITSGLLLCRGLLGRETVGVWLAAIAVSHCLHDSPSSKEQLLRVQLATSLGNPPVSLLQQCSQLLTQSSQSHVRMAILQLLCTWLYKSPVAVVHFLHNPTSIPFLTSQAGSSEGEESERLFQGLCAFLLGICLYYNDDSIEKFNRSALLKIIQQRVSVELFVEKLEFISKNDNYLRAAQKPQMKLRGPVELTFDFEFTKLFKLLEAEIVKAVQPQDGKGLVNGSSDTRMPHNMEQHEKIVREYKDLIKQQDGELVALKEQNRLMAEQSAALAQQLADKTAEAKRLAEENFVLRNSSQHNSAALVAQLESELSSKLTLVESQKRQIVELEQNLLTVESNCDKQLLTHWQSEAARCRAGYDEMSLWIATQHSGSDPNAPLSMLQRQLCEVENQLQYGWEAYEALSTQLGESQRRVAQLESAMNQKPLAPASVELQTELEALRKEQEDLLVLLADQDQQLQEYKAQIRQLGGQLRDSDEE